MDLHPEGDFKARVCRASDGGPIAEFGYTMSDKPYVRIQMEITDGETKGAKLEWTGWFTGNATKYTLQALRRLGFEGDDLAALVSQKLDKPVVVEVKHDEYKGRTTARVDRIKGPPQKMDAERLKSFAAEMRNAIRANDTQDDDGPPPF